MITFKSVKIDNIEAYEKDLKLAIPSFLVDDDTIQRLKVYLGIKCDEILVEYPYYDGDYLSTYYIHYAQKLKKYEKVCCRLHIMSKNEYYGYITIRPTEKGTRLGKSFIDPSIIIKKTAYLSLHKFKSHIVGNEMEIISFPWKSQQTDISVCAHTATWTVLRYFGNKFKNYSDTTIGEIVERTKNDRGRKTPSTGLTPLQVSDLIQDYGFSPIILQNPKKANYEFTDQVMSYIESGLPMIAFLNPIKHAISILGHGEIDLTVLDDEMIVNKLMDPEILAIPSGRLVKELYVMDDNCFPYQTMSFTLPDKNSALTYCFSEIEYCVVPLYNRMQLAYDDLYARFVSWMQEKEMNWERPCVCRIYITSATSLKRETLISDSMNEKLQDIIGTLTLPKFVWCIDLASFDNFKLGLTSGRIIVDTTSATLDENPWILRHDLTQIDYVDIEKRCLGEYKIDSENMYEHVETSIDPYKMYRNNLVMIKPNDSEEQNG